MPCHAMPCHAMPCDAMPCDAMPCDAMPCHAISYHTIPPSLTQPQQCGAGVSLSKSEQNIRPRRPPTPSPRWGRCGGRWPWSPPASAPRCTRAPARSGAPLRAHVSPRGAMIQRGAMILARSSPGGHTWVWGPPYYLLQGVKGARSPRIVADLGRVDVPVLLHGGEGRRHQASELKLHNSVNPAHLFVMKISF